jgi:hypothetical protein
VNSDPTARELVLIALGGSGRRTAVLLREKIDQIESENLGNVRVNCRVLSIDFPSTQDTGYIVRNEEYLPLLRPGENLFDNWAELSRDIEKSGASMQPWMKVGVPSEMELYLARDAQKSGIRRVDYLLKVHQSIERITINIRSILEKASTGKDVEWMGPDVVILGSLAGRTSSELYVPVLKVLEELSDKFQFAQVLSFLYTPAVFEELFPPKFENSINSFTAINRIVSYFWSDRESAIRPAQFLINKADDHLANYRDDVVRKLKNETVDNILQLIYLEPNINTWNNYCVNYIKGSFRSIDLLQMKDPGNINHSQIFALLDTRESSLTESAIDADFLKKVHPGDFFEWAWIKNGDQAVLCGTRALSPWVFSCLVKPIEFQLAVNMGRPETSAKILEILYSNDLYDSIPVSRQKLRQIIFSINVATLLKKIKVVEDGHYCEFQFMPLEDKNHLSLKMPSSFRSFFPNRIQALIGYLPFALIESSRTGQLSILGFYQIDGEALLSDFLNNFQNTENSGIEIASLIEEVKKRIEFIESTADRNEKFQEMLVRDLKELQISIADLEFKPFN